MSIELAVSYKLEPKEDAGDDVKKFLPELIDWMVERWSLGAEEAARIAFPSLSACRPPMARAPRLVAASAPA